MKPRISKQVKVRKIKKKGKGKSKKETRNWLELPRDVMIHIFLKLGVIDLLFNAQSVCSSWRKLAKEPQLFRCIDMRNSWNHFDPCDFGPIVKMATEAIDRSCGQLVEFSITYFGTDQMLQLIVVKSCSLRCLRLATCYQVTDDVLIEVVKKLPLLEELELCLCSFVNERVIEVAGSSCPQLKSFRLNQQGVMHPPSVVIEDFNNEALAIAANIPQLRRLHLFGNQMNNNGLLAILDKCPHLEYLDLRQCFNVDLKGDLLNKCEGIKSLRLPSDSTDGYEFDATIHYSGSYDEDYGSVFSYEDYINDLAELDLSDDGDYNFSDGSEWNYYEDYGF